MRKTEKIVPMNLSIKRRRKIQTMKIAPSVGVMKPGQQTLQSPSQTSEENKQAWEGPGPSFLSSAPTWTPLTHCPAPHTNREGTERKTHGHRGRPSKKAEQAGRRSRRNSSCPWRTCKPCDRYWGKGWGRESKKASL